MNRAEFFSLRGSSTQATQPKKSSAEIDREVAEFLARGGRIQTITAGNYLRTYTFEGTANTYNTGEA